MDSRKFIPFLLFLFGFVLKRTQCVDTILQYFMDWNNVPSDIYLGLLSDSTEVVKTPLVNGTCFQYHVNNFDKCKFYSDCCAMTPPRSLEQLAPKTFSCHDSYYIVDNCPPITTNEELRNLCENPADSGELIFLMNHNLSFK